ncbi:MAG: ABC transporter permease [Bifidobacterium sp.]|jgi:ABC-2 type transport system permease protein
MSLSRSLCVARTTVELLARDPMPSVIMTAMPLIMIALVDPSAKAQLAAQGYVAVSGAAQNVPGMAVLFAFLSVEQTTTLFYREHAWGTWDRLRASPASTADIILGKVGVRLVVQLIQTTCVFGAGAVLFRYRPTGSVCAIALVMLAFTVMLVAFAVMLVSVCATMDQANTIGMLGGMVMAGIGGALAPVSSFPRWVGDLAHCSPAYWTLDALHRLTLEHADMLDVAPAIGMILLFAMVFALVSGLCFRANADKVGTT